MGRTDTRSYDDRKKMYEGGWEVVRAEHLESCWKEKYDEWSKRPSRRLPKWFGERPGKKKRLQLLRRRNMMKRKKMRRNMMRKRNKLIFKNILDLKLQISCYIPSGWFLDYS